MCCFFLELGFLPGQNDWDGLGGMGSPCLGFTNWWGRQQKSKSAGPFLPSHIYVISPFTKITFGSYFGSYFCGWFWWTEGPWDAIGVLLGVWLGDADGVPQKNDVVVLICHSKRGSLEKSSTQKCLPDAGRSVICDWSFPGWENFDPSKFPFGWSAVQFSLQLKYVLLCSRKGSWLCFSTIFPPICDFSDSRFEPLTFGKDWACRCSFIGKMEPEKFSPFLQRTIPSTNHPFSGSLCFNFIRGGSRPRLIFKPPCSFTMAESGLTLCWEAALFGARYVAGGHEAHGAAWIGRSCAAKTWSVGSTYLPTM